MANVPVAQFVLDEEEAAVTRILVEKDRVLEGQPVWNRLETAEVEGHQHEATFRLQVAVGLELYGKRPPVLGDGDVIQVVALEMADPLVEVLRRDLEGGSRESQGRIEVRKSDLEAAADRVFVDLEVEIAVAEIVAADLGRRERRERHHDARCQPGRRPPAGRHPSPLSPAMRFLWISDVPTYRVVASASRSSRSSSYSTI